MYSSVSWSHSIKCYHLVRMLIFRRARPNRKTGGNLIHLICRKENFVVGCSRLMLHRLINCLCTVTTKLFKKNNKDRRRNHSLSKMNTPTVSSVDRWVSQSRPAALITGMIRLCRYVGTVRHNATSVQLTSANVDLPSTRSTAWTSCCQELSSVVVSRSLHH